MRDFILRNGKTWPESGVGPQYIERGRLTNAILNNQKATRVRPKKAGSGLSPLSALVRGDHPGVPVRNQGHQRPNRYAGSESVVFRNQNRNREVERSSKRVCPLRPCPGRRVLHRAGPG